jgi:prophage regulatory protein
MRLPTPANDNVKGGTVLLRFPDLKAVKGITFSRSHLARLEEAGVFPKRVKIGANTIVWLESEVDAYIASKIAARDAA